MAELRKNTGKTTSEGGSGEEVVSFFRKKGDTVSVAAPDDTNPIVTPMTVCDPYYQTVQYFIWSKTVVLILSQINTLCTNLVKQVAQLSQRDRAAGWVSYGQKWKTGTGRQYVRTI